MELYRQRVPACSGKALSNRTGLQAARSLKQHPMQHVLNKDPLPIPHAAFASHCQAAGLGARCLPADASRRSRDNIRQDDPPPDLRPTAQWLWKIGRPAARSKSGAPPLQAASICKREYASPVLLSAS